ncbi:MAG: MBL fold metallo-hydrolase [Campylobacterota bacterium]|nr:MBL fold metallo-hydrolase [Campylobacterota bacterium]
MKLTFLGTSATKPTKERNVSALALEFDQDNKWYLFDCGEATQHQILRTRLSIGKLDTIFITHLHGDHYYGLLGLLNSKKLDAALNPLRIYAPKGIKKFLECVMDISEEYLGYELTVVEFEVDETFVFDKFSLKILPLIHSVESFAFYIKENDVKNRLNVEKLKALGVEPSPLYGELKRGKSIVFEGKKLEPKIFMLEPIIGRTLIIAGDNSSPDILAKYLINLDLLVHESTYTQEVYDNLSKKFLHTTAKNLGIEAQKQKVKNLIATHISPRYCKKSDLSAETIQSEIECYYRGRTFVANDFDIYYLSKDGLLEKY